ncbi:glutaredoxin family protein [Salinivirga cyanobacteriivorans]
MILIQSPEEIGAEAKNYYVLVYKSGSSQSECAYKSIEKAAEKSGIAIFAADVNKTRAVHKPLGVSAAPTLVKVAEGKPVKHIKGCQSEGFYETLFEGKEFTSFSGSGGGDGQSVLMYTTPTCTYCNSLKTYLNEQKVPFTEIDVSKDHQAAQEMAQRSGQQGVPQTVIDGQVVIGFDRNKINQLLNLE